MTAALAPAWRVNGQEDVMHTLLVSELMTSNLRTVYEDEAMNSADWDMAVNEIRHLPVVDGERRLVGLLSDRDVMRSMIEHRGRQVTVGEVMSRNVKTVPPSMPAVDVVELMLRAKCHALPVVDEHHHVVGIVTSTDFLELAHRALSGLEVDRPHARA
jgi:CBS domain-containing membrane protein